MVFLSTFSCHHFAKDDAKIIILPGLVFNVNPERYPESTVVLIPGSYNRNFVVFSGFQITLCIKTKQSYF